MRRRRFPRQWTMHDKNRLIFLLLLLAVLVASPALVQLTRPSSAAQGKQRLQEQLTLVAQTARASGHVYTLHFTPRSHAVRVLRWTTTGETARAEPDTQYGPLLPKGVMVERTTLPAHTVTISDSGFLLSTGKIILRGRDGSIAVVALGEE